MYLASFEGRSRTVDDIQMDEYAQTYPLLNEGAVHAGWKKGSWQVPRIGEIWKRTGKIFSVPYDGINTYPAFQFGADGTPLPLMEKVLQAFPSGRSPWQLAFWMTVPNAYLGGKSPAQCVQTGDDRVVVAAGKAKLPLQ